MAYTEARKRAIMKYRKTHIKRVSLDMQNTMYEEIKAAAENAGESVNGYIKKAIRDRMYHES